MVTYTILAIQVIAVLLAAGIVYIAVISKREEIQERQARKKQADETSTLYVAHDSSQPGSS